MNAITIMPPSEISALTSEEIDVTLAFARAEKASTTRRAYESDWRGFTAWCSARGCTALPAAEAVVACYISDLAHKGRKSATVGRHVAAIAYHHKQAGQPSPVGEVVRSVLRGIRRVVGTAPQGKSPLTSDLVTQMVALCPDTLTGKRDRALLLFAFAGAFRGSEVAALRVEDLTKTDDGLLVTIRRSKTDQTGQGQQIGIPRGSKLQPCKALEAWLSAANITSGPLFRGISKGDRIHPNGLRHRALTAVLKRYCGRLGLNPAEFAAHSLRSGYLTSAAQGGASIWKLAEQSRHRSLDTLRGYVKKVDLWKDHSGASFL